MTIIINMSCLAVNSDGSMLLDNAQIDINELLNIISKEKLLISCDGSNGYLKYKYDPNGFIQVDKYSESSKISYYSFLKRGVKRLLRFQIPR